MSPMGGLFRCSNSSRIPEPWRRYRSHPSRSARRNLLWPWLWPWIPITNRRHANWPEARALKSDIQVLHIERIFLDEFAAGFHVFAHQGGKNGLALGQIFQLDGEQGALFGIEGGFPELLRTHFAQAFVALHRVIFAALSQHVIEELARSFFFYHFCDGFLFGG